MQQLWKPGPASVREVQESLPEKDRPAYTTVQTIIYLLEEKKAVRRVKKIARQCARGCGWRHGRPISCPS